MNKLKHIDMRHTKLLTSSQFMSLTIYDSSFDGTVTDRNKNKKWDFQSLVAQLNKHTKYSADS
jgi:hypothetical protein